MIYSVKRGARLLHSLYIKRLPLLIKSNAQVFEIREQSLVLVLKLKLDVEMEVDVDVAT